MIDDLHRTLREMLRPLRSEERARINLASGIDTWVWHRMSFDEARCWLLWDIFERGRYSG